jgi:hypothetical protein
MKNLLRELLHKYYLIYRMAEFFNNSTENQFWATSHFYEEWISLLKNIREEYPTLFLP